MGIRMYKGKMVISAMIPQAAGKKKVRPNIGVPVLKGSGQSVARAYEQKQAMLETQPHLMSTT